MKYVYNKEEIRYFIDEAEEEYFGDYMEEHTIFEGLDDIGEWADENDLKPSEIIDRMFYGDTNNIMRSDYFIMNGYGNFDKLKKEDYEKYVEDKYILRVNLDGYKKEEVVEAIMEEVGEL